MENSLNHALCTLGALQTKVPGSAEVQKNRLSTVAGNRLPCEMVRFPR